MMVEALDRLTHQLFRVIENCSANPEEKYDIEKVQQEPEKTEYNK